jgi:hypothetical protein
MIVKYYQTTGTLFKVELDEYIAHLMTLETEKFSSNCKLRSSKDCGHRNEPQCYRDPVNAHIGWRIYSFTCRSTGL